MGVLLSVWTPPFCFSVLPFCLQPSQIMISLVIYLAIHIRLIMDQVKLKPVTIWRQVQCQEGCCGAFFKKKIGTIQPAGVNSICSYIAFVFYPCDCLVWYKGALVVESVLLKHLLSPTWLFLIKGVFTYHGYRFLVGHLGGQFLKKER